MSAMSVTVYLMMSMSFSFSFNILNIHGIDYRGIINGTSKIEAMVLLKNANLYKKVEYYKT